MSDCAMLGDRELIAQTRKVENTERGGGGQAVVYFATSTLLGGDASHSLFRVEAVLTFDSPPPSDARLSEAHSARVEFLWRERSRDTEDSTAAAAASAAAALRELSAAKVALFNCFIGNLTEVTLPCIHGKYKVGVKALVPYAMIEAREYLRRHNESLAGGAGGVGYVAPSMKNCVCSKSFPPPKCNGIGEDFSSAFTTAPAESTSCSDYDSAADDDDCDDPLSSPDDRGGEELRRTTTMCNKHPRYPNFTLVGRQVYGAAAPKNRRLN